MQSTYCEYRAEPAPRGLEIYLRRVHDCLHPGQIHEDVELEVLIAHEKLSHEELGHPLESRVCGAWKWVHDIHPSMCLSRGNLEPWVVDICQLLLSLSEGFLVKNPPELHITPVIPVAVACGTRPTGATMLARSASRKRVCFKSTL